MNEIKLMRSDQRENLKLIKKLKDRNENRKKRLEKTDRK